MIQIGDTVEFIGCTVEQQKWGGNDIPHALVVGGKYKVKNVEVHNWHTKIELEGIEGKFNSVCFKFDTADRQHARKLSNMMNENYTVPQELVDLWEEATAAEEARDAAVKGYFKFQVRNAIYLGVRARAKKQEFWKSLRELYPDLGANIEYDYTKKTVSNIEKKA